MDELVRWLTACLDEDERIARGAAQSATRQWLRGADVDSAAEERTLSEIYSKRRIIAEVVPEIDGMEARIDGEWGAGDPGERESMALLRLLALPYADRPGYRAEWAPTS